MKFDPVRELAFLAEGKTFLVERTRGITLAALLIYPAFLGLDILAHYELRWTFLLIRVPVMVALLATYGLTYTRVATKFAVPLSMGFLVVGTHSITVMALYLGGFESDYYVGTLIAMFAAACLIPWRLRESLVYSLLHIGGYIGITLTRYDLDKRAISPLFFMAGCAAFSAVAAEVGWRARRRDFALRADIEQAHRQLLTLDQAKTRFFANVSHELRTPLTLLLAPLDEILAGRVAMDEQLAQTMLANARRLLKQVNELLKLSKIDAGELSCTFEPGHLSAVCEELVRSAQPHAASRGITLSFEPEPGVPETLFDRDKVETILANLLSNALKFTVAGGKVTVLLRQRDATMELCVRDTGRGIPADKLDVIFERFRQLDDSASRDAEGTGIGLALVRELTLLHDGKVSVESELGVGSSFIVTLPKAPQRRSERRQQPRRKIDRIAQERTQALVAERYHDDRARTLLLADLAGAHLNPTAEQGPTDAPHILVVEDAADLRTYVSRALARRYRVRAAENGVQGLEQARAFKPDLIICDVMMPQMDGYEMCRQLRADSATAQIPVIILSARAGTDMVVEGLDLGAIDYLTKPFDIRELEARVSTQLRAKAQQHAIDERESRLAAIGKMTGSIIHDMGNPLMAVLMTAEMLRSMETPPPSRLNHWNMLMGEANRLQTLLRSVLGYARDGSLRLSYGEVDLASVLERLAASNAPAFLARGAQLHSNSTGALRFVADETCVQRIAENLLANARDAVVGCSSGAGEVWLQATGDEAHVTLRVADNGPGFPQELRGRLFEAFASKKVNGTGLGLATVRNLVVAHGGTITADFSPPEGGCAFLVTLPRRPPTVAAASQAQAPSTERRLTS